MSNQAGERRQAGYHLTVELPLAPESDWTVTGTYIAERRGGSLRLAGLLICPNEHYRALPEWNPRLDAYARGLPELVERDPLTRDLLRDVPLAKLLAHANATVRERKQQFIDAGHPSWFDARPGPLHPGKATPDRDYLEFARRYAELVGQGHRQPRTTLAREFHLTDRQVRDRISACRQRELLKPTTPGRAGGGLTEKAANMRDAE
jgi:hypothetical protein